MATISYNATAVTPDRVTSVTWGIAETWITEAPFEYRRKLSDLNPSAKTNAIQLASGVWILKPVNDDFGVQHETTTGQSYVMRLSEFDAAGQLAEFPYQRVYSDLPGVVADAGVAASGDYYIRRQVTAGAVFDFGSSISVTTPQPSYSTTNYRMRRILHGPKTGHHDADTGYMLKLVVLGAELQNPDNLVTFYFGGHVDAAGHGQFALMLSGNGRATLMENIGTGGGSASWAQVGEWRYCSPSQVSLAAVAMRIIPHFPKFIEFSTLTYEAPHSAVSLLTSTADLVIRAARGEKAQTYTHKIANRGDNAFSGAGNGQLRSITGAGTVAFDVREDLGCYLQLARLVYPASGTITDRPFTLPPDVGNSHVLRLNCEGYNYQPGGAGATPVTGMAIVPTNEETDVTLTPDTESWTFRGTAYTLTGWDPPGGMNRIYPVLTLTNTEGGTKYHTPCLTGWTALRNAHTAAVDNGQVTAGRVRELTVSGPDTDPEQETAHLMVTDEKAELTVLATRALIPTRIETTWDPADQTKKVVLFEGYSGRAEADLRGRNGATYPSPNWRDYQVPLIGKWDRLTSEFFWLRTDYSDAHRSPSGQPAGVAGQVSWLITDIIQLLLVQHGFAESQVDVPADTMRIFGPDGSLEHSYVVKPGTRVQEYLEQLARDYLNAFLIWDANAGALGMWRLVRPPTGTETAVWNFTSTPAGGTKLQHLSRSYAASTSPILGPWPYTTYIVPPEGNHLTVWGGYKDLPDGKGQCQLNRTLINRKSFNAPGFAVADPTSMDYLGRLKEILYVDPTLVSQQAVDFIARRVYEFACRGRKYARFTAEYVLFAPAEPSIYTTRTKRPLRIGDVVMVDGARATIRSVQLGIRKDSVQLGHYEVEFFRTGGTFH
jgi:hypothetical protein